MMDGKSNKWFLSKQIVERIDGKVKQTYKLYQLVSADYSAAG